MCVAISSPLSSWRKWAAPSITRSAWAPGIRSTNRWPAFGVKIGSESEKQTSAGFSQRETLAARGVHLGDTGRILIDGNEQRELRHAGLRLGVWPGAS